MISGGQTKVTEVQIGRQVLCKEKTNTPAGSPCAKGITSTVAAAKRGLSPVQQVVWRQMVYAPALLQAKRFCAAYTPVSNRAAEPQPTRAEVYKRCTENVLSGSLKFIDIFKKNHKWSDYLVQGAKLVKKYIPARLPSGIFGRGNPYKPDVVIIPGTQDD